MSTPAPHRQYWDSFYAGKASTSVPGVPSAFAETVLADLLADETVVELGFGTGRDALWFAQHGHDVLGMDFADTAVEFATRHAETHRLPAVFSVLDLYDDSACAVAAKELARTLDRPVIYGRFLLHSLEERGRTNLFDLAAVALASGGRIYLEFRTGKDAEAEHVFGDDHFRAFLDPSAVAAEIAERGGTIRRLEEGHGFAVYRSEDPHVARLVADFGARRP